MKYGLFSEFYGTWFEEIPILEQTKQCKSGLRISGWNAPQIERYFVLSKHYSFSQRIFVDALAMGFELLRAQL